jgi:hypothetical protein
MSYKSNVTPRRFPCKTDGSMLLLGMMAYLDQSNIIAIGVVLLLVVMAAVWSFFIGPAGPLAAGWNKEVRELEIKIRMGCGPQLVEDLQAVARLYARLGRHWDAEQSLRRAMLISAQEYGATNPGLVPLMEELSRLMLGLHRRGEADTLRKQIKEIADKQRT